MILENCGTATAGALTTLTDTTQNWVTNILAGKRVKLLSGTGQGNEYSITSNTQTVLTFASATAPDVSTAYAILEAPTRGLGVQLEYITASTDTTVNNIYLYSIRGGAGPEISRYNITKEQWDLFSYFPQNETFTTGSMARYDGIDRIYIQKMRGRIYYFDLTKSTLVPFSMVPYGMSTAILGARMQIIKTSDGLKYLYVMRHTGTEMWRVLIFY